MPFYFHICDDFYFILECFERFAAKVMDICRKLFSVSHTTSSNRRRPTGSKGRWQKAISVPPSRAGPLPRDNI